MLRNMYQRLPVAISGGWYPDFCNVYIFMSTDYFCKEGGKKAELFPQGKKEKKRKEVCRQTFIHYL